MTPNSNEPAFPAPISDVRCPAAGLTKREEFAKAIMAGMAAGNYWSDNFKTGELPEDRFQYLYSPAKIAVAAADALLVALAKEESP